MTALARRTRSERRTSTARKSTLFCPDCGRAASVDDWSVRDDVDGETIACPDCGGTLTDRPADRR